MICDKCARKSDCTIQCAALDELNRMYYDKRFEDRSVIISLLREELDIQDCEVADDLRELGEQIIIKIPEMAYISQFNIKVGYVRSYQCKTEKGKTINADCRKVNKVYGAYIPYDFIITFYEPNIVLLTDNQKKILMLHELKHIGIGIHGLRLEEHDIDDFKVILKNYGLEWNEFQQDVPDILGN